jgi:hypothetical protein
MKAGGAEPARTEEGEPMTYRRAGGFRAVSLWAVLLVLGWAGAARGDEAYYLLVFGAQRVPNTPDYSHSFATFVRATWNGPAPAPPRLEAFTISWLPQTLRIRALAFAPECGQNLGLHETLRWALGTGQRVSLWGPYQIDRDLYVRALAQLRLLESGQILYKANDVGHPTDRVSNCIHAISGMTDGHRLHVIIPSWGETASYYVEQELMPWVLNPCQTHPWVASALGLGGYPIIYRRPGENPRSGLLRAPVRRLLGGEREVVASYGPPY